VPQDRKKKSELLNKIDTLDIKADRVVATT
jgi:hypothetical protein